MKKFLMMSLRSVKTVAVFSLLIVGGVNAQPKFIDPSSITSLVQSPQNMVDAASALDLIGKIKAEKDLNNQLTEAANLLQQLNGRGLPSEVQQALADLAVTLFNNKEAAQHDLQVKRLELQQAHQVLGVQAQNLQTVLTDITIMDVSAPVKEFINNVIANITPVGDGEHHQEDAAGKKQEEKDTKNKNKNTHKRDHAHKRDHKTGAVATATPTASTAAATEGSEKQANKAGNNHKNKHKNKNKAKDAQAGVPAASASGDSAAGKTEEHKEKKNHKNKHNNKNKAKEANKAGKNEQQAGA